MVPIYRDFPLDDTDFVEEVTQLAADIHLNLPLKDAHVAASQRAVSYGGKLIDIATVLQDGEQLLKRREVLERLCPALASANNNVTEIAKVVSSALKPLALEPGSELPVNVPTFAALVALIVRSGPRVVCRDYESPPVSTVRQETNAIRYNHLSISGLNPLEQLELRGHLKNQLHIPDVAGGVPASIAFEPGSGEIVINATNAALAGLSQFLVSIRRRKTVKLRATNDQRTLGGC